MPKKGFKSNNPNGRPKGKPNKTTTELRLRIKTFLESNFEDLQESYIMLEPVQKLAFYQQLLKFAIPVMTSQDMKINFEDLTETQLNEIVNRLISLE